MSTLTLDDLEDDQQQLIEKTDIQTLAAFCQELQGIENDIDSLEQQLKAKKEAVQTFAAEQIGRRRRDDYTDGAVRIPIQSGPQ